MATFKNITDQPHDVPNLGLHVEPGGTFEVPDDAAYSFDNQSDVWARSRTKNPDTVIDADAVSTGPSSDAIPAQSYPAAPAAPDAPTT